MAQMNIPIGIRQSTRYKQGFCHTKKYNIPNKYIEQIIMGIGAYNQNSRSAGQKIYRVGKNDYGGISMFSYTVFKKNPTYAKQIIKYLK